MQNVKRWVISHLITLLIGLVIGLLLGSGIIQIPPELRLWETRVEVTLPSGTPVATPN